MGCIRLQSGNSGLLIGYPKVGMDYRFNAAAVADWHVPRVADDR